MNVVICTMYTIDNWLLDDDDDDDDDDLTCHHHYYLGNINSSSSSSRLLVVGSLWCRFSFSSVFSFFFSFLHQNTYTQNGLCILIAYLLCLLFPFLSFLFRWFFYTFWLMCPISGEMAAHLSWHREKKQKER